MLDDVAKRQDLQSPESIDVALLEEVCTMTNSVASNSSRSGLNGGTLDGQTLSQLNYQNKQNLLLQKKVEEVVIFELGGENGTGGRPLKIKPDNPYLEIDLIDPLDPILFEGEVQKYKPGFQAQFIDRWVQVT